MKAYSIDLRERIVHAVGTGQPKSVVARLLGVAWATVDRYVRQHRATGDLSPKPRPGATPRIRPEQYPTLVAQLEAAPDATLAEHCETWERTQHVRVSVETMRRTIARVDWRLKKKTLAASEQDPVARAEWLKQAAELDPEHLVVVDEMGAPVTLTRRYARAPGGERARGSVPRNQGTGTTLIAALTTQGIDAPMTLDGAVDTATYLVYVREVLCPTLRPGQVVLMDNLSPHKDVEVQRLIEAAGCQVRFFPSYSPDFSPIEHAFSKIKALLRKAGARTKEALEAAIAAAIDAITKADALGYFRHCGFRSLAQYQ